MSSDSPSLLAELKRRKVTRVALAYGVCGMGAVEGAQLLTEALGLQPALWQLLARVVLAGFPIALLLAWLLELTPGGIRRQRPRVRDEAGHAGSGRWSSFAGWAVAALSICLVGWQALGHDTRAARAVYALERIEGAVAAQDWMGAFMLARAVGDELPDSVRQSVLASVAIRDTLLTEPAGVHVSWRPFGEAEGEWEALGTTPLEWDFPRAAIAVRLERPGYAARTVASNQAFRTVTWQLRSLADPDPQALHVPGGTVDLLLVDPSLANAPKAALGDYLIDRHEVTNREFQGFVDAGGYQRRELWTEFLEEEPDVTWEEAVGRFVDRTGRPGPSTWEIGAYPDGTADHPVTGVSWYEAAAYARFVGRQLPTVYHWYRAAGTSSSNHILPFSNMRGEGTAPVGGFPAVSPFGASDMAGNAREWVRNATGSLRYTLGGGWDDPTYAFFLAQPQPPLDRSGTNGFRLITDLGDPAAADLAAGAIERATRDFAAEEPVSDEVFAAFRELYAYDDLPLNAVVDAVDTVPAGVRQRITFDAAYGGERMVLYLFLPEDPPEGRLQTVLYFPGSGALRRGSIEDWSNRSSHMAFLTRSGRAVAFPVFKSTFEREDDFEYRLQDESKEYRDHVVQWYQDLARSLDYLETRADLDAAGVGYFGYSWGGRMGALMLALEPRFSAGVLYVAGLSPQPTAPSVEPLHFAPRVRVPVLMLSGEFDQIYPLESAARPLFERFGSPEKRHVVAPGGHNVPGDQLIRETLDWYDRWLGPVR